MQRSTHYDDATPRMFAVFTVFWGVVGLLAAAWLRAVATGSPLLGAAVMAVFWLGTLPALALVQVLSPWLRRRAPGWWPRVAAAATLGLGLSTLWRAWQGQAEHWCG